MEQEKSIFKVFKLLLIAGFIEGGAVMAVELLSAKLIAPYYGNSLYVWSAVLAMTLLGLASGYFLGGKLAERQTAGKFVLISMISVSIFILFFPFISSIVMSATLSMPLKMGIVVSCALFIFPPLLLFGMISPLIIGLISVQIKEAGKVSGTVYATSTAGGILFTFLTGFWLIPELGLNGSCYFVGFCMVFASLLVFFAQRKSINE